MNSVSNISTAAESALRITPPFGTSPPSRRPLEVPAAGAASAREGVDSVELTGGSPPASAVRIAYDRIGEQGFDTAKVERVRAQLREGTYITPEKFDAARAKLKADLELLP